MPSHDLYKTGDYDAPDDIKDRNGHVVLCLCRRCGKAEIELSEPCAADYAFIVKAVINHDALVEALTSVRAEIDLGGSPKLAAKIDTALAAVGGSRDG